MEQTAGKTEKGLQPSVAIDGARVVFQFGGLSRSDTVEGADRIRIGAYHWADANGDGRIDDNEIMPAYYVCEEIKRPELDWKTIEAIWSGKGYRWKPAAGFEVLR